jgi:hypothetical protein
MSDSSTRKAISVITAAVVAEAEGWKTRALIAEQALLASQEESALLRSMLAHTNKLLDALMAEREAFLARQASSRPFCAPVLPSQLS